MVLVEAVLDDPWPFVSAAAALDDSRFESSVAGPPSQKASSSFATSLVLRFLLLWASGASSSVDKTALSSLSLSQDPLDLPRACFLCVRGGVGSDASDAVDAERFSGLRVGRATGDESSMVRINSGVLRYRNGECRRENGFGSARWEGEVDLGQSTNNGPLVITNQNSNLSK